MGHGGLGVPINQEDLAYVLLTFGYLIPKGMETWGRKVPRQQKEDFCISGKSSATSWASARN
jgi:hypothetical protein